ncbi:YqgE/AlgH family protein, partial [Actinomadura sp. NPDC049753]|uniref:YqgE/AlgH family protein n=1 Tax=Actinomadura sp. NPDC049753 TaxID=3154739 RepID=UPI0034480310
FAGYAGWSPGQLRSEVEEGSWYLVPAEAGDVWRPRDRVGVTVEPAGGSARPTTAPLVLVDLA